MSRRPSARAARIDATAEPLHELAARYGLNQVEVPATTGRIVEITLFELGLMVMEGLGWFCRSTSDLPETIHVQVDGQRS